MSWHIDPHSGGNKIPPALFEELQTQAHAYEQTCSWHPKHLIKLRFKNQFCYVDSFEEGKGPDPLCRLRYFAPDRWSFAFYTYSNERYEPCVFPNGEWFGTIEQAIAASSLYLI